MIEGRTGDECFASWTFQAGISGSGGVANALQVVMPEGRTPGRHDGRDAEVRRFSPFPLCRHPFSVDDTLIPIFPSASSFSRPVLPLFLVQRLSSSLSLSLSHTLSLSLSFRLSSSLFLSVHPNANTLLRCRQEAHDTQDDNHQASLADINVETTRTRYRFADCRCTSWTPVTIE